MRGVFKTICQSAVWAVVFLGSSARAFAAEPSRTRVFIVIPSTDEAALTDPRAMADLRKERDELRAEINDEEHFVFATQTDDHIDTASPDCSRSENQCISLHSRVETTTPRLRLQRVVGVSIGDISVLRAAQDDGFLLLASASIAIDRKLTSRGSCALLKSASGSTLERYPLCDKKDVGEGGKSMRACWESFRTYFDYTYGSLLAKIGGADIDIDGVSTAKLLVAGGTFDATSIFMSRKVEQNFLQSQLKIDIRSNSRCDYEVMGTDKQQHTIGGDLRFLVPARVCESRVPWSFLGLVSATHLDGSTSAYSYICPADPSHIGQKFQSQQQTVGDGLKFEANFGSDTSVVQCLNEAELKWVQAYAVCVRPFVGKYQQIPFTLSEVHAEVPDSLMDPNIKVSFRGNACSLIPGPHHHFRCVVDRTIGNACESTEPIRLAFSVPKCPVSSSP